MKAEIGRDVISDLWPLYKTGEASPETARLVAAFLDAEPAFRALLEESDALRRAIPETALSPETDMRLIELARQRIRTNAWLIGAAIGAFVFVSMSFLIGALYFALSRS